MHDLRLAMVSLAPAPGQNQANRSLMQKWLIRAAAKGANMVCFPEMAVTGYDLGDDIITAAETVPGPSSVFFEKLATEYRITILAGLAERDQAGHIYISHLVCIPKREAAVYRKAHLGPPEKERFTAGNDVPVFDIPQVCFGVQLCFDAHFPELSARMACAGAELILIPHASPRGRPELKLASWMRHLPARAFDNGVFIAACNLAGPGRGNLSFPGVAVVLGPTGHVLTQYTGGTENLMLVDLKADELAAVRNHPMRFFLPHRRPELYGPDCVIP